MIGEMVKNNLIWFPEKGVGYYPVSNPVYDSTYFKKYYEYSTTQMGKLITKSRVNLVKKYYDGLILDVGIGCGHFIIEHGNAVGYDINPFAIKWLIEKCLYEPLSGTLVDSASFWDSLEHIKNPKDAIKNLKYVFVSIPIFRDIDHILKSKHFKKNEHYWYFTHTGIINWFFEQGFEIIEHNDIETQFGREDIGTYFFKAIE